MMNAAPTNDTMGQGSAPYMGNGAGVVYGGMSAGPKPELMNDNAGFYLFQTNSECCYICAPPNLEWGIYQHNGTEENLRLDQIRARPQLGTAIEEATFCERCFPICGASGRRTRFKYFRENVSKETPIESRPPAQFVIEKDRTCSYQSWCCRPYLAVKDAQTGAHIGGTRSKCVCSTVPTYEIEQGGVPKYLVSPDSCCCGCFLDCTKIKCKCKATRCCTIPFRLRSMDGQAQGNAYVQQLFPGWKNELCTRQSLYEVRYPPNIAADPTMKPILLSAALLIDMIHSAEQDDAAADGAGAA